MLAEGKVWGLMSGNQKRQKCVDTKPVKAFEI